jgi:bifunctional NMN adenylyltransferase/nudix hydrolase
MNKQFDLLVFCGRMQPPHNEHIRIINKALEISHNVLVLLGSSGKARTIRNPFTLEERKGMIESSIGISNNVLIKPLYDKTYNDSAWVNQVQNIVKETALDIANKGGFRVNGTSDIKIGLIGASKDNTSYYLKLFPQWESYPMEVERDNNSTTIRDLYFSKEYFGVNNQLKWLPVNVDIFLQDFQNTKEYKSLKDEYDHVKLYKKQWEVSPYPVKHLTVDTVVEQSGHILLIKRKASPGKGLWALPGGHLELNETLLEGAIRELKEETGIKVPSPVLIGSIVNSNIFDDPHRSTIGRVVTQAYHIKLKDDVILSKIKGMDDASKAKWLPLTELKEADMYDDHYAIVQYFMKGF